MCYDVSYPRKTLIEHFSTMACPNCPGSHRFLSNILKGRTDYVWLVHHTGYDTDELTVGDSEQLRLLLNVTAAPRLAYDRRVVTQSLDENNPIIPGPDIYSSEADLDYCVRQPAFVRLEVEPVYDEASRHLSVQVKAERTPLGRDLFPDARLTVQLVEDSVHTVKAQNGSGDKIQNHVYRQSLTSVLGDAMTWDENVSHSMLTADLPEGWLPENLSVVVFVSQPTENETARLEVLNAAQVPVWQKQTGTGSSHVAPAPVLDREYYNLHGVRINRPAEGVYLEKIITSEGSTVRKHIR